MPNQFQVASEPQKTATQRILFLKNEPEKLLKTNDEPKKRTGNEAETNRAMLLKKKELPEKRTENEPKNEAGHLIENKGPLKKRTENGPKNLCFLPVVFCDPHVAPFSTR